MQQKNNVEICKSNIKFSTADSGIVDAHFENFGASVWFELLYFICFPNQIFPGVWRCINERNPANSTNDVAARKKKSSHRQQGGLYAEKRIKETTD